MFNFMTRSYTSLVKSKHPLRYFLWLGLFLLPGGSIVYMSRSSECIVMDNGSSVPREMIYRDFTIPRACDKALAMCSYFSREPGKCVVKK